MFREKRPYSLFVVLSVAAFVGIVRLLLEFMVCTPGFYSSFPGFLSYITFYLQNAFLYSTLLAILLPGIPWRKNINVVLVGVFVGIFPPLLDTLILGPGTFIYSYILSGLQGWNLLIYNPEHFITPGEAATLWFTVLLVPTYVWIKTRSITRTIAGAISGYGVMFLYVAVVPTMSAWILKHWFVPLLRAGELAMTSPLKETLAQLSAAAVPDPDAIIDVTHRLEPLTFNYSELLVGLVGGVQLVVTVICYLILNPRLALHLGGRALHSLPFAILVLFGSVLTRTFVPAVDTGSFSGLVPAFALALAVFHGFNTAIVQNDHFDRDTDRRGSLPYIDIEDVRFFDITMWFLAGSLFVVRPRVGVLLALFQIVSVLYNYPFYRGKRYFPANYKIEGIWGWSAFMIGVFTVLHPRMQPTDHVLTASLLVFGGWSIFNYFKDYKDIREDYRAGVQTSYVLLKKRGFSLRRFHLFMRVITCVGLFVPLLLLFYLGSPVYPLAAVALICILPVFAALGSGPKKSTVEITLAFLSLYFIGLTIVLEIWL